MAIVENDGPRVFDVRARLLDRLLTSLARCQIESRESEGEKKRARDERVRYL